MNWYIFALFGALFDATYYAAIKRFVVNIDQYVLAAGMFLTASAVLFPVALVNGLPEINPVFYYAALGTAALNFVAANLYFRALKTTDLSLAIPMIAFTPVFLIFTSFIMLGEMPGALGILGILLIVAGSYTKNLKENIEHPLEPFREIFRNRGVFYMLIVALIFSISANLDKVAVNNSGPLLAPSVITLMIGSSFLALSLIRSQKVKKAYKNNIRKFVFGGAVLAASSLFFNIAITMQFVSYVISLKRFSVLFAVFLGGLAFREKHFGRRIIAALLMIAGALLIILH